MMRPIYPEEASVDYPESVHRDLKIASSSLKAIVFSDLVLIAHLF